MQNSSSSILSFNVEFFRTSTYKSSNRDRWYSTTFLPQFSRDFLARSDEWIPRYINLIEHPHNNLRITRILKCLGEFGYENFQKHLVRHFLTEIFTLDRKMFNWKNCEESCLQYWIGVVKNDKDRGASFFLRGFLNLL